MYVVYRYVFIWWEVQIEEVLTVTILFYVSVFVDYDRLFFCEKELQLKWVCEICFSTDSIWYCMSHYWTPRLRVTTYYSIILYLCRYFELQMSLVEDTGLPLFLHCRNAFKDFFGKPFCLFSDVTIQNMHFSYILTPFLWHLTLYCYSVGIKLKYFSWLYITYILITSV